MMNDVSKAILYVVAKKRRKMMNDVSKAILYVVAKKKKKKKRKMMCEEEEEMSKHELSTNKNNKRNMDDVWNDPGEAILSMNNSGIRKTIKVDEERLGLQDPTPNVNNGDIVNLSDLLFTKNRNFLINSNQQRLEAKDLSGKFVFLYFMPLAPFYIAERAPLTKQLLDIYSKLHPRGDFEIVLVATHDDVSCFYPTPRQCFLELFDTIPWPAIPLSDLESRKRLETIIGDSVIIDPRGVVLQCNPNPLFLRYGAAAYPFTNERILMQQPLSIQKLLATPERDYLINNNGDQVPLDGLDHKVVGLYFCPCLNQRKELRTTRTLKKLYQELSKNTKEFEIVLIYTHGWCDHEDTCGHMVEDSFLNEIKAMPWLALPFEDTNCNKKLQRIFQHPQELGEPIPARLVIIGPLGKFVEPLGTHILLSYGAPAYPFSLRSAVNLELEMVKKLKLEMFWDLDTVFMQKNGSQVRFSQYIGKRIIVLYQKLSGLFNGFWREMKERYFRMKGTDDEFEVIHICKGIHATFDDSIEAPVPWFIHPHLDQGSYASEFIDRVWPDNLTHCGLLAFDRDGSVVRMKRNPELGDNMTFPFYQDGDLQNEVLLHVREYIKSKCELECVNDEAPWD